MAIIEQTVFLGHDLALFLPDPDWRSDFEMGYRIEVDVDQGASGRQDRKARHLVLRHRLKATFTLEEEDSTTLQALLWQLNASYVGVPIVIDVLNKDTWGDKIHNAQWVLEYDETGYEIHAADALPPNPSRAYFAPLFVGRLKQRPALRPADLGVSQFELELLERSPWDFRIAPAPQALDGVDWPAALEANWRELPEDATEQGITYHDVGDTRVEGVNGLEDATARTQSILVTCDGRDQIRTLLNFYLARKGRVQSFNVPWAFQPGDDTPATPHATKATFVDDELVLTFRDLDLAEATIKFRQAPWEVAGVPGETPELAEEAFFFRYKMNVPGGPLYWRFTSWEQSLQRTEGGVPVSYLGDVAGLMEHDKITQTIDLGDDATTIGSWIFEGNPLVRILQRTLDVPLEVEILKGPPSNPDGAETVYLGEVADVTSDDRKLTATTLILGGQLDIKVPNFFYGEICNYGICGPGCNDAGTMPEANWTFAGTIASIAGTQIVVTITSNPPGADLVDDYFAKAWLQGGAGETYELRHIVRSQKVSGTQQRFTLKKALRALQVGDALSWMAYCCGTRTECETKFGNYPRMGAHPHIGNQNLSIPSRDADAGAGGKK